MTTTTKSLFVALGLLTAVSTPFTVPLLMLPMPNLPLQCFTPNGSLTWRPGTDILGTATTEPSLTWLAKAALRVWQSTCLHHPPNVTIVFWVNRHIPQYPKCGKAPGLLRPLNKSMLTCVAPCLFSLKLDITFP